MELALKVVLWLVAALLFSSVLNMVIGTSCYKPITTTAGDAPPNLFENKSDIACVPGPSQNADYYTDESGGGLCGGMEYVHRMGQEYAITDGIGEPLLSM